MSGDQLDWAPFQGGGRYQDSGAVTVAGGNGSISTVDWIGDAAATVTTPAPLNNWLGYAGPLAAELATLGGGGSFSNATLTGLGAPGDMQGMAIWAANPGDADAAVLETISYSFPIAPLPAGVSFLLWNPGAASGSVTGPFSFTFTAEDGDTPLTAADWSFTLVNNPFGVVSNSDVSVTEAGVVTIFHSDPVTDIPDTVVVATANVPITQVQVTAQTFEQNAWGLAIRTYVPQDTSPGGGTLPGGDGTQPGGGGAPCFVAGTAILTPRGPAPVERLAPGDAVLARLAGVARVVWVGRRCIDLRRHARPASVRPVRILADVVAPGVPARDLRLSPDHAVLLGGVLIPVKYLINGLTVFQERGGDRVEYYHIELPRHDVVLAEALPAESYLDTGNRGAFEGGAALALHPDFAPKTWETDACAPLWGEGGPVDAVRALLAARARALSAAARAG